MSAYPPPLFWVMAMIKAPTGDMGGRGGRGGFGGGRGGERGIWNHMRRIKLDFREHYILHIFLHGLKPLYEILQTIRSLRKLIEVHEQKSITV